MQPLFYGAGARSQSKSNAPTRCIQAPSTYARIRCRIYRLSRVSRIYRYRLPSHRFRLPSHRLRLPSHRYRLPSHRYCRMPSSHSATFRATVVIRFPLYTSIITHQFDILGKSVLPNCCRSKPRSVLVDRNFSYQVVLGRTSLTFHV